MPMKISFEHNNGTSQLTLYGDQNNILYVSPKFESQQFGTIILEKIISTYGDKLEGLEEVRRNILNLETEQVTDRDWDFHQEWGGASPETFQRMLGEPNNLTPTGEELKVTIESGKPVDRLPPTEGREKKGRLPN